MDVAKITKISYSHIIFANGLVNLCIFSFLLFAVGSRETLP